MNSKNTFSTACSFKQQPNQEVLKKFKHLDDINPQKYTYESKRPDNFLRRMSLGEGNYYPSFDNSLVSPHLTPQQLVSPQINTNPLVSPQINGNKFFNFDLSQKFNDLYLETKEQQKRRTSLNLNFQSNLSYYSPFECFKDNIGPIKSKRVDDAYYNIDLEKIIKGFDKRTTLMIRNIPNKYTFKTFLEDVDLKFEGKYDLFYLPPDYTNNCNLGYCFINFVDAFHILYFYFLFRGKKWRRFNSEKICELAYAKVQGKKELIAHFEKGTIMKYDAEDKRPVILQTPNVLPNVELPLKYFDAFLTVYPNASYEINIQNKDFIVHSLGN
jgi:hypothetical protein